MKGVELESALVNWSVRHSGHELRRSYIGLSGIGDCPALVYDRYAQGQFYTVGDHLKSRLSFELERALIDRLQQMGLYQAAEPISLHGGLIQGHLDGWIRDGEGINLLEIKTVPNSGAIPKQSERLPMHVFWQAQAYLHYSRRLKKIDVEWALVLYLARDSGLVSVRPLHYSGTTGSQIEARVELLVEAVRRRMRPACICGKHLSGG